MLRNSVNPSATSLLTSARKDKQDRPYHLTIAPRELCVSWGRNLTVVKKQRECFQLSNPCQYRWRVQRAEEPNKPNMYKGNVQISNKYSADILHDLIGHMVDQQQIPLAIFGGKGTSSVKSLVFTASSIITVTQEYVRTSSQQQSSTWGSGC